MKSTTKKAEIDLIRKIESEFVFFITNMVNEVNRKIAKGKQRLELMNSKLEQRPAVPKQAESAHDVNEKISKLLREAEEAGLRGDVGGYFRTTHVNWHVDTSCMNTYRSGEKSL